MDIERNFVLPPAEEWRRSSVDLPVRTWKALDAALERINATRSKPERLSRDRLLAYYVDWADREQQRQAKGIKL